MKKLFISIITPTFNRAKVLLEAVKSVQNQMPSEIDWEMVIQDDGSTDETKEVFSKIKDSRIKYYYRKENKGVNATRNEAIKKSKGDFILFLDSDDILTNDCFKTISELKKELSEINFFGTVDENGKKMYYCDGNKKYSYREWLEGKYIGGEFISLVKKSVFNEFLFDENRFAFESIFWNRVIKKYEVSAFDKVMRIYGTSESNRISKELLNPKKVNTRLIDYESYIAEFEKDYMKFDLEKKLADIFEKMGFYGILSENMEKGRFALKKSLKLKFKFGSFVLLIVSYFGKTFSKFVYKTYIAFRDS